MVSQWNFVPYVGCVKVSACCHSDQLVSSDSESSGMINQQFSQETWSMRIRVSPSDTKFGAEDDNRCPTYCE